MVREMGKKVFSLTSEHKIIIMQVCLMASHIKTRAFVGSWSHMISGLTLHFLWSARNSFCIHNTLALRLYKAAASSASRLRSAVSLAIIFKVKVKRIAVNIRKLLTVNRYAEHEHFDIDASCDFLLVTQVTQNTSRTRWAIPIPPCAPGWANLDCFHLHNIYQFTYFPFLRGGF